MSMKHEYREFLPSLVTLTCILTKLCSFLTTEFSVKNMIFYQTIKYKIISIHVSTCVFILPLLQHRQSWLNVMSHKALLVVNVC